MAVNAPFSTRDGPALDRYGFPVQRAQHVARPREAPRSRLIFAMFVLVALATTVLQTIGFGTPPDAIIPLVLPVTLLATIAALAFAQPVFDSGRVWLYFLFVIASALSTTLFALNYSFKSLALYATLYLPMVVSFRVSEADYRRCMNFFSTLMLVMTGLLFAQHLIQVSIGWRYWPNIDTLLPPPLLIPNFNYVQPIVWGLNYMKPNAVFFLEVSFLSQFIALALGIELVLFRRWWRVADRKSVV